MTKTGLTALVKMHGLEPAEAAELRLLIEQALERLRSNLVALSSTPIVFSAPSLRFETFGQLESELGTASFLLAIESENQLRGALVLSGPVAWALSAVAVGEDLKSAEAQPASNAAIEQAPLTPVETKVLSALIGRSLEDAFAETFSRLFGSEIRVVPLNMADRRRLAVYMLGRDEQLAVALIQTSVGSIRGQTAFVLPLAALIPVRANLRSDQSRARTASSRRPALLRALFGTELEVRAIFADIIVPLATVRSWREGSVINLGKRLDSAAHVDLRCANVPIFQGMVVEDLGWRKVLIRMKGRENGQPESHAFVA